MKIGDIVVFTEDYYFNNKLYEKGHRFKVTGSSYRGLDLEDFEGNRICETLFIDHIIAPLPLSEIRDEKIDKILNGKG